MTQELDECRKAFEAWFLDGNTTPLTRHKAGWYEYMPAQSAWIAWMNGWRISREYI